MNNSENTKRGKDFQTLAAQVLAGYFGMDFDLEVSLPIGSPPKSHKFDLASKDRSHVGESKNFCWTEGGNSPSAKLHTINEAVLLLSFLARKCRFIVLPRMMHRTKGALADHYCRAYGHLLRGVEILEIDVASHKVRRCSPG